MSATTEAVRRESLRRAAIAALGPGPLTTRQLDQVDGAVAAVERALRNWALRDPTLWVEEIVRLDIGRVNTAIAKLMRSHSSPPTIGALFDVYNHLDTGPPAWVEVCEHCDGTGCVEAPPRLVGSTQHPYSQVAPCAFCRAGEERARSPEFQGQPR